MAKAGLQFSQKDEWYTPKPIVDFFGPFDYDPCTTKRLAKNFGIKNYDTIKTDGLKADWKKYKKVWVNPPFTRKFDFLNKAVETVMWNWDTRVFFLLPIETLTTKKFHEIVGGQPYRLWLPDGRIKFEDGHGGGTSPAFGTVVLEFGSRLVGKETINWSLYA